MKKFLVILSVLSVLTLVGCNKNENFENNNSQENINNQQQEEFLGNNEIVDINEYIGDYDGQQSSLKISKVSENEIALEYRVWQKLIPRTAGFEIKNVKIDGNGNGKFSFEDDGWSHKGEGKISLEKDKIILELYNVKSSEKEDNAMWGVTNALQNLYKINKIDSGSGIVSLQYEKENVRIPFINLNYDNIRGINEQFESMIEFVNSNQDPTINHYEYDYYLSDNILSVVGFLKSEYGVGANRYDVYNIDILTGELVSNKALLDITGKTEEDVMILLKEAYIREFITQNNLQEDIKINFGFLIPIDELYSNLREKGVICTEEYYNTNTTSTSSYEDAIGFRNEVYYNTISQMNNIKDIEDVQMYLNGDEIGVVTKVGGFAGAT